MYVTYLFLSSLVVPYFDDSSDILVLSGISISFCQYNQLRALCFGDKNTVNNNKQEFRIVAAYADILLHHNGIHHSINFIQQGILKQ